MSFADKACPVVFRDSVNREADDAWRPQYRRALQAIRERTRALRWRG